MLQKKYIIYSLFLSLVTIMWSCNEKPVVPVVVPVPQSLELVFPQNNMQCNIPSDSTENDGTVLFEWQKSENTDFYEIYVTNLLTQELYKDTTSEVNIPLVLTRATPYEWYVIARSFTLSDTAVSEIWRFYNAGIAIESHIPFPAQIISPKMAEQIVPSSDSLIKLVWSGMDLDNDISYYNVYFGTDKEPPIYVSNTIDTVVSGIKVSKNYFYFWQIETFDKEGNSSKSGIYQFKVKD